MVPALAAPLRIADLTVDGDPDEEDTPPAPTPAAPTVVDVDADSDDEVIPSEIAGVALKRERHTALDAGIRCACPFHGPPCRKFRSLHKDVDVFGVRAAAFF